MASTHGTKWSDADEWLHDPVIHVISSDHSITTWLLNGPGALGRFRHLRLPSSLRPKANIESQFDWFCRTINRNSKFKASENETFTAPKQIKAEKSFLREINANDHHGNCFKKCLKVNLANKNEENLSPATSGRFARTIEKFLCATRWLLVNWMGRSRECKWVFFCLDLFAAISQLLAGIEVSICVKVSNALRRLKAKLEINLPTQTSLPRLSPSLSAQEAPEQKIFIAKQANLRRQPCLNLTNRFTPTQSARIESESNLHTN